MKNLQKVLQKLKSVLLNSDETKDVFPTLWKCDNSASGSTFLERPEHFFINQIEWIIENSSSTLSKKVESPIIYNLFTRFTTAFDHNQDGKILNFAQSFKETGTFLKAIAFLPYLKKLGVNIVYLLPITAIGSEGKKGDLGSPYSISNPYKLDEFLNEPLLDLEIEELFAAFVEAGHLLGMKIIVEFVFRTASKDSELAIKNPEWFYWIKEDIEERDSENISEEFYGAPVFTEKELEDIKLNVKNKNFKNLIAPHKIYRDMFTNTPVMVQKDENGRIVGITEKGEKVKIPGAFADWPPNDIQPAWSDVTYLKLYDSEEFNYIAYNTVRMYDEELAKEENEVKSLWQHIENIIPYYQKKFNIDGVMIDMGHSLPKKLMQRIVSNARAVKEDFIFWEENFVPNENSVKEGYDLVLGYMPFDAHNYYKMREIIKRLERKDFLIKFFATSETHNTPRTASRFPDNSIQFNKLIYTISAFLPLPLFLHSGFELCEKFPVNTGLGFENIDTSDYTVEKLPLFSTANLKWDDSNIVDFIKKINKVRNEYFTFGTLTDISLVDCDKENILMFKRKIDENKSILVVANYFQEEQTVTIELQQVFDILEDKVIDKIEEIKLLAFEVKIFVVDNNQLQKPEEVD